MTGIGYDLKPRTPGATPTGKGKMTLNLDPGVDECDSCGQETEVEPELLVQSIPIGMKLKPGRIWISSLSGYQAMYPLLCKDCLLKTFTPDGAKLMFDELDTKNIKVNVFASMTELSKHYQQEVREEDTASFKIPEEKARRIEPKSRW